MIEPHVHLAYAPRGAGVLCAMFWFEQDAQVYGWFTGARAYELPAAFFMLENYYSNLRPAFYRSAASDVYGEWLLITDKGEVTIDPPVPLPEPTCHELERLHGAFVQEWLFYCDDPDHASEAAQLGTRELPVLAVNVRPSKLTKFETQAPVWTYTSPGTNRNIVDFLGRRWPLDYTGR